MGDDVTGGRNNTIYANLLSPVGIEQDDGSMILTSPRDVNVLERSNLIYILNPSHGNLIVKVRSETHFVLNNT